MASVIILIYIPLWLRLNDVKGLADYYSKRIYIPLWLRLN